MRKLKRNKRIEPNPRPERLISCSDPRVCNQSLLLPCLTWHHSDCRDMRRKDPVYRALWTIVLSPTYHKEGRLGYWYNKCCQHQPRLKQCSHRPQTGLLHIVKFVASCWTVETITSLKLKSFVTARNSSRASRAAGPRLQTQTLLLSWQYHESYYNTTFPSLTQSPSWDNGGTMRGKTRNKIYQRSKLPFFSLHISIVWDWGSSKIQMEFLLVVEGCPW